MQSRKQLLDAEATGSDNSFICCSEQNCEILGDMADIYNILAKQITHFFLCSPLILF